MSFWKKKNTDSENEPKLVAVIKNPVLSEMYQDILKENGIPSISLQKGAGGYIKIITGGLLAPDSIYVNLSDYDKALELYKLYIESNDKSDSCEEN